MSALFTSPHFNREFVGYDNLNPLLTNSNQKRFFAVIAIAIILTGYLFNWILQEELIMLTIKVLGPGCENCKRLAWLAERAATHLGVGAQITKITDYAEIMKYPLLSTPGLVINEKVVASGRIPSVAEITTWLVDALETA
jgi:small redox-active disulfide protein 2